MLRSVDSAKSHRNRTVRCHSISVVSRDTAPRRTQCLLCPLPRPRHCSASAVPSKLYFDRRRLGCSADVVTIDRRDHFQHHPCCFLCFFIVGREVHLKLLTSFPNVTVVTSHVQGERETAHRGLQLLPRNIHRQNLQIGELLGKLSNYCLSPEHCSNQHDSPEFHL